MKLPAMLIALTLYELSFLLHDYWYVGVFAGIVSHGAPIRLVVVVVDIFV